MKNLRTIFSTVAIVLFSSTFCFAQEDITITTYYPSPSGNYNNLFVTNGEAIGDTSGDGRVNATDLSPIAGSLTASGRIGIGTNAPVARLDILDSTNANNNEKLAIRRRGVGDVGLSFQQNGVAAFGLVHRAGVDGGLSFLNNYWEGPGGGGTEIMRILGGGNVGIGTSNPTVRLDVRDDTTNNRNIKLALKRTNSGDVGVSFQQNGQAAFGIIHRAGTVATGSDLAFVHDYWE
ncbi:MAG: hypothetical protein PHO70_07855, partial [Candidatus Omnitrophica bacterium]|nr:hypothetical protein [Candidatus Omnitrophota bacterium]